MHCGENWRITNGIIRAYDGRDGRKYVQLPSEKNELLET